MNPRPTAYEGVAEGLASVHESSQTTANIGVAAKPPVQGFQRIAGRQQYFADIVLTTRSPALRVVPPARDELLSVTEAAQRLRVATATIYKACTRGLLRHVRVLNVIRIPESALASLVVPGLGEEEG